MKLLLIIFLLFTSNQVIYSQARHCDIKSHIVNINVNDTFYSPDTLIVKYGLINLGPDSLFKGDLMGSYIKFGAAFYPYNFPVLQKNIGIGDTAYFYSKINLNFPGTVYNIDFCAYVELGIMKNGEHFFPETTNEKKNNTNCILVNHISRYNLINENNVNNILFYPNPIVDILNIKNVDSYKLYNSLGNEIFIESAKKNETFMIDFSNLNAGFYYLIVNSNKVTKSFKLIKL